MLYPFRYILLCLGYMDESLGSWGYIYTCVLLRMVFLFKYIYIKKKMCLFCVSYYKKYVVHYHLESIMNIKYASLKSSQTKPFISISTFRYSSMVKFSGFQVIFINVVVYFSFRLPIVSFCVRIYIPYFFPYSPVLCDLTVNGSASFLYHSMHTVGY